MENYIEQCKVVRNSTGDVDAAIELLVKQKAVDATDLANRKADNNSNICVVRLATSTWYDNNGIHINKTLRYLRRKCSGYNIIYEDCRNGEVEEVVKHITNIDECEDGIYKVVTCNESTDWETGYVDDYDYKLIPYND